MKEKKESSGQTTDLSPLQIGEGVARYILELQSKNLLLEQEIRDLKECVKERDTLQKALSELQGKYNSAVIEGSIAVPSKMF